MMELLNYLNQTLELKEPLYIGDIKFVDEQKEIIVTIKNKDNRDFCPNCTNFSKIHDRKNKKWRHLNFKEFKLFIEYETPRIKCTEHGVKLVNVSWAQHRHHFTKQMEEYVAQLALNKPLYQVGKLLDEHDTRIRRIIKGVQKNEEIENN